MNKQTGNTHRQMRKQTVILTDICKNRQIREQIELENRWVDTATNEQTNRNTNRQTKSTIR